MERSLTSVFEKHLGFPGAGRTRVTAEAFVDRVVDRLQHFDEASEDLARWVDQFFETEHLAEDRQVAFAAFAEGREHPVLEISLGEQEFVVVDSDRDDEIVVVSGAGSMVVQRTAELMTRLRAAELPAPQQHRLTDAFKPSGERVYLVNGQGAVTALDAKAVMAALRSAPMRAEPVARVTPAATHLPAFTPAATSSTTVAGSVTPPRPFAAREVQAMARRDLTGTSAGSVRVVERGGYVRPVSPGAARVWQSLTAHATTQDGESRAGGVTAVSLGQQTFAVKAGGVTALVQRPTRPEPAPVSTPADRVRPRAERVMPAWLRELLAGALHGRYWVEPAVARSNTLDARSSSWIALALQQADAARVRAKAELSGELDPEPSPVRAVRPAPAPASTVEGAMIDASVVVVAVPTAPPSPSAALSMAAPASTPEARPTTYRLSEKGVSEPLPIGHRGSLPATTLRALFTALERSAAYEGQQLRTAVVTAQPKPAERSSMAPEHVVAVSQVELETAPHVMPSLPSMRTSIAAAHGVSPGVRQRAGASTPDLFALPFDEVGTLRIGRELDAVMARAFERVSSTPVTVPATLETLVRISGTPERVRIEVPDLRRARPRVEARPGTMGAGAVDLSALGELQWSTYAAQTPARRTSLVSRRLSERLAGSDEHRTPGEPEPSDRTRFAPSPMDLAAPPTTPWPTGAGATAFGAMAPASVLFGASGWPVEPEAGFGDSAQAPLYVEPALATAPLPLAGINFRRTPLEVDGADDDEPAFAHGATSNDEDPGTLNFDIPLPLHAQMSGRRTLPVFARSRAAGPIGQAHAASHFPAPAPGAASSSAATSMPAQAGASAPTPSSQAAPAGAASATAPAAKAMPPLRRPSRDASAASAPQVLVERPVTSDDVGSSRGSTPASRAVSSAVPNARPSKSNVSVSSVARPPVTSTDVAVPHVAAEPPDRASGEAAFVSDARTSSATARSSAGGDQVAAPRAAGFDGATADTVLTGPAARRAPAAIGARAFGGESSSSGILTLAHPAAETVHVLQQSGAAVRPRRRGPTPLRFRYPTSARWWAEPSNKAGKASYGGRLAAPGAVVASSMQTGVEPARRTPGPATSPARATRVADAGARRASMATASGLTAADATYVEGPSTAGAHPPVGERETAYVVLNPDGHAQVMNARAASQVTRARAQGAPLDMAVVAAVPPSAPTLEQMAVPGHDRPHAKAKKDQPKAAASARTDAMSLQGTVDSLAQRIYHRLRRRLEADRERFGG